MENADLVLGPAASSDCLGLTTIFAKSFHPVSSFMRQAIPDTPMTRAWWDRVNSVALDDPDIRLMKVVDRSRGNQIAAIARYRIATRKPIAGKGEDSGTWSKIPLTEDHDRELCTAFIEFMGNARKDHMGDRLHILIELLATVHDFKGRGAGRLLVGRICEDADRETVECFVETNRDIVPFYEKFGFVVKERRDMPGGYGYSEFIMVRQPQKMY